MLRSIYCLRCTKLTLHLTVDFAELSLISLPTVPFRVPGKDFNRCSNTLKNSLKFIHNSSQNDGVLYGVTPVDTLSSAKCSSVLTER